MERTEQRIVKILKMIFLLDFVKCNNGCEIVFIVLKKNVMIMKFLLFFFIL